MGSGHSTKRQLRPATPQEQKAQVEEVKRVEQSAPVSTIITTQPVAQADNSPFRWQKGSLIGQGSYGQVFECLNLATGETHVVKEVMLRGDFAQVQREISSLKREIMTLKTLDHPNIVRYLHTSVSSDQKCVQIIMEYVSGGSLKSLLEKFGPLEEAVAQKYIKQLVEALKYVHDNGIIHRDLKCDNVLLDRNGVVKLTDFGAAKKVALPGEDYTESKSLIGSPYWMAPEVVRRTGHSFPSDIWSLGCVLIEMLTGRPPWSDHSTSAAAVLKLIHDTDHAPSFPSKISLQCKSFLYRCLRMEPDKRATATELQKHPYLTGEGMSIDHLELLRAEEESEPEVPRFEESGDQYDLVYDLEDIQMVGKTPVKQPITRVQSHKVLPPEPVEIMFEKKTVSQVPSPRARNLRLLVREPDEYLPRPSLNYNPEDLIAQTRYAERMRAAEEKQKREVEAAKRSRMQAWQHELQSASRLNVNY